MRSRTGKLWRARRVAEVLAAFDQFMASPAYDEAFTTIFMERVVQTHDRRFFGWPNASVRAVLSSYLEHSPVDDLADAVSDCRATIEWLVAFEAETAAEQANEKVRAA